MRLEIRKSGGPVCAMCGATEIVATKHGTDLARSLSPRETIPWWRPLKRAMRGALIWNLSVALEEIRDETRKV